MQNLTGMIWGLQTEKAEVSECGTWDVRWARCCLCQEERGTELWNPQGALPMSREQLSHTPLRRGTVWARGGRGWCREVGTIPVWRRAGAWRQEGWALWMKTWTLKWNHLAKRANCSLPAEDATETCSYTLNARPTCTLHDIWGIQRSPVSTAMDRLSCGPLTWAR